MYFNALVILYSNERTLKKSRNTLIMKMKLRSKVKFSMIDLN